MTRFSGLEIDTTKDTFIPRPETELLVRVCLRHCEEPRKAGRRSNPIRILDIGTGSGNIAVSLTKLNKGCRIVALDIREEALSIARENAKRHGVADRIEFIKSDLFAGLDCHCEPRPDKRGPASRERGEAISFDIIVSNPPYVERWEIETLAGDVKKEPRQALDGGEDGLDFYRRIINGAPRFLKDAGLLIMELGYNQAHKVKRLLNESGDFGEIEIFKDLSHIDRVIKTRHRHCEESRRSNLEIASLRSQ